MIQSSMPNWCSCKAKPCAYASSEKDFEERIFLSLGNSEASETPFFDGIWEPQKLPWQKHD